MFGRHGVAGFTLIEALVAAGIIAILAAIAVPTIGAALELYALITTTQTVASAIRGARYTAVSKNRKVRVRFNCPAVNQFRVVEMVGSNTIDDATDRCSTSAYPYPDQDAANAPDVDGPILLLPANAEFGAVDDLEIDTTGRTTPLTGCPPCATGVPPITIVVSNGDQTRTITVTTNGQVSF